MYLFSLLHIIWNSYTKTENKTPQFMNIYDIQKSKMPEILTFYLQADTRVESHVGGRKTGRKSRYEDCLILWVKTELAFLNIGRLSGNFPQLSLFQQALTVFYYLRIFPGAWRAYVQCRFSSHCFYIFHLPSQINIQSNPCKESLKS